MKKLPSPECFCVCCVFVLSYFDTHNRNVLFSIVNSSVNERGPIIGWAVIGTTRPLHLFNPPPFEHNTLWWGPKHIGCCDRNLNLNNKQTKINNQGGKKDKVKELPHKRIEKKEEEKVENIEKKDHQKNTKKGRERFTLEIGGE